MTRGTRRDAVAYLARRPYDNVFLQWAIEAGYGLSAPDEIFLNRERDGRVSGVAYFGAQLVIAADSDAVVDLFAIELRRHPGMRAIVGPKAAIDRLWENVRHWHRKPNIVRDLQPLYALRSETLGAHADVDVRLAHADEAELVADHSGAMMLGELGYDPRTNRAGFTAGVRRAIEARLWWVWIVDGELRFQCNVGSFTRATAQVQGVWTPEAVRGRGYATAALGSIARRLLGSYATLSLYVNDFNVDAVALYERLGFVRVGEMSTLLF